MQLLSLLPSKVFIFSITDVFEVIFAKLNNLLEKGGAEKLFRSKNKTRWYLKKVLFKIVLI